MYQTKFSLFDVERKIFLDKNGNGYIEDELFLKAIFNSEEDAVKFVENLDYDDPYPIASHLIIVKVIVEK